MKVLITSSRMPFALGMVRTEPREQQLEAVLGHSRARGTRRSPAVSSSQARTAAIAA